MESITIKDFQKFDIRIGTIKKAEVPSWSHWVMKLVVDFGAEIGERVIFAGIMHYFKPDELEGEQFPFVVNMEKKKIGPEGDYSEGMMLAADLKLDKPVKIGEEEVQDRPILFHLSEKVPDGTKVM